MSELKPCPFCGGKAHDLPGGSPPEVIHKNLSCPAYGVHDRDAWNRRAEPGWVRVEDGPPRSGADVIVWPHYTLAMWVEDTGHWWRSTGSDDWPMDTPTHWMDKPAPPATCTGGCNNAGFAFLSTTSSADRPGEG